MPKGPDHGTRRCLACDKAGPGVPLLKCSACLQARYCSKECQKADWPNHKASCNVRKGAQNLMQQAAGQDSYKHLTKWRTVCHDPLTRLTHTLLKGKLETHVVLLKLKHEPASKPPFKVESYRVLHMEELSAYGLGSICGEVQQLLQKGKAKKFGGAFEGHELATGCAILQFPMPREEGPTDSVSWVLDLQIAVDNIPHLHADPQVYVDTINTVPW